MDGGVKALLLGNHTPEGSVWEQTESERGRHRGRRSAAVPLLRLLVGLGAGRPEAGCALPIGSWSV